MGEGVEEEEEETGCTRGYAVSRFNIYGLKYSRDHTGGGECSRGV